VEQEEEMKRRIGVLWVVAALCVVLVVPAAAAGPVELSGEMVGTGGVLIGFRPVGQGEDDHYCQVAVDVTSELSGDISGELLAHCEVLQKGPCASGPATTPSVQRCWGTFTGEVWDGEQMRSGTCKTFYRGGYYWAEDGETLLGGGHMILNACTGGLKGAHVKFDLVWVPDGADTYTGRAFFSNRP
jgi:hypothetical protein